jgi:hypothetical protein
MTKIEQLEREVRELSAQELASFREWFAEFDAAAWDRQIADDADNGKLDRLADAALADHAGGRSRKL